MRVNERSPWSERVGCVGVVVAADPGGVYPQQCPGEAIVLLDDDPLDVRKGPPGYPITWSCVFALTHLDTLAASPLGPAGKETQ